ncbi:TonB-dependent receptor [uncultured Sphingomonas sp.]|uniref:TonB-dependent receptor n=1 Tax=uncultured Sphingomonas sp. TaxID=158754 RepID=UPI0025F440D4|nr:TonB-dependent receptor [uncultured Sphingomonas sp.]
MKTSLFTASVLAMVAATPAAAQTAPTTGTGGAPASEQDYQSANDIVVTATRRDETVQDVPIAITAVAGDLLQNANVTDVRGLEQLAPSLQTVTGQSNANNTNISIRGIGTSGDNPGFEPAVGIFIDGVFRSRAGIAVAELPEVDRVEILRGPQGTLFGRNTSAGALSIFTAQPKFDFGGYVEGTYGNYDAYSVKAGVTGPVSEQLALRVDGGWRQRDGYIKDANTLGRAINDLDRWYVRGQALYDTSTFSFRLIGDYYKTDEQCCGAVTVVRGPTAAAIDAIAGLSGRDGIYDGPPQDRTMAISPNRNYAEKVRDWGVSGELNADIGDLKLTSITAYRDWRVLRDQDIDFSGIDRAYRQGYRVGIKDFTQELRLQGSLFDGKLDFLVGGFYLNEDNRLYDTVRLGNDANRYVDFLLRGATASAALPTGTQFFGSFPAAGQAGGVPLFSQVLLASSPQLQAAAAANPALFAYLNTPLTGNAAGQGNNNDYRTKTNAFAAFTHNIINVTDRLSLTLGARWNHETKDFSATIRNDTTACGFFNSADPRAVTYRTAIRAANQTLFNNLFLLSCNPAVSTEFNGSYADKRTEDKLTGTAKLSYKLSDKVLTYVSYDRGYKSGGYNMDQASFDSVILGGNGPQASDLRFGAETVDAYELGVKMSPSRAFTFNAAVFYQKFQNLQNLLFSGNSFVVFNIPRTTSKGVEAEAVIQPIRDFNVRLGYTWLDARYDASNNFNGTLFAGSEGQRINNQPENVVTIATTWTPRLTGEWRALLHADMRYNSEVNIPSASPNPITGRTPIFNPGYPIINARIGVQSEDRTKRLELWVENLTNQYYNVTGFAVPEQTGTFAGYPSQPRFYGITGRFGF